MVPHLETARLRLRAFESRDAVAHAAMLGDPAVMRHIGGHPLGAEDAWRRLISIAGLWPILGYGYWAVERKEDGLFLGLTGFADFQRDMRPSIEGSPEMGWIFASRGQGQGYCQEAVQAALAWADETLNPPEIVAIITPENAPSIRVAERAGFSLREDAVYRDQPVLLFRRPVP